MLRLISILMMLYSYFLVQTSLAKLPPRIPTHFDAFGKANAWGSPDTLWILLVAQVVTSLVFLGIPYLGQRFPGAVNLGAHRLSDYTSAQQGRILPLLHEMSGYMCLFMMSGYMCLFMNTFFVFMLRQIIKAATAAEPHLDIAWPLGTTLIGTLFVTLYYLRKISRVAKGEAPP